MNESVRITNTDYTENGQTPTSGSKNTFLPNDLSNQRNSNTTLQESRSNTKISPSISSLEFDQFGIIEMNACDFENLPLHEKDQTNQLQTNVKEFLVTNKEGSHVQINTKKLCKESLMFRKYNFVTSFQILLQPCENKIAYDNTVNRGYTTSVRNSDILLRKSRDGSIEHVTLFPKNTRHQQKRAGGDFWQVVVFNKYVTFTMDMLDRNDGTYLSLKQVPKEGSYEIKLSLVYSNCEGLIDPPLNLFKIGKCIIKVIVHGRSKEYFFKIPMKALIINCFHYYLFHDGGPYHIDTSPLTLQGSPPSPTCIFLHCF